MTLERNKGMILIGVYILFYFIILIFSPKETIVMNSNIMMFLGSGIASLILYYSYKNKKILKKYTFYLFFTALFCFFGDLTYFYTNTISGKVPLLHISTFFYIMDTLMLLFAIYHLIDNFVQMWDGIQIFIDGFILGLMLFYIAWAILFNDVVAYLLFDNFTDSEKLIHLFYIFTTFLMSFGLILFFTFNKLYLKNKNNLLSAFGFLLYSLGEISYFWTGIYQNIDESILNITWPVSLLFLAVSSLTKENDLIKEKTKFYIEKNNIFNILLILLSICLFFLARITILVILPLLIFRVLISKFIKVTRYNVLLIEDANLDPLTRVFNRTKFIKELEKKLNSKDLKTGALIIFEINRLKYINSFYGYQIGDQLLIESVKKIKFFLKESDLLGRWNGDEFIIFTTQFSSEEEIKEKTDKILETFNKPFKCLEKEIHLTLDLGISFFPKDSSNASDLVRDADIALNFSRSKGKNTTAFYDKNSSMEKEYEDL